jgi:hypothetical protein
MSRKKKPDFDLEEEDRRERLQRGLEREAEAEKGYYNEYLLEEANKLYNTAKREKTSYTGPRDYKMESDQIKAICAVLSEELYKIKKHLGMDLY